MKTHNKYKDKEEKECAKRFLPYYCQKNDEKEKGVVIEKNPVQDEVDVFVKFKNRNKLKIQVTVADSSSTANFRDQISRKFKGKSTRDNIISSIRDRHDMKPVSRAFETKVNKYEGQKKDMSDIFLLIDDQMGDFPKSATNGIDWNFYKNYFKEVWYVGRTCCIYKIL
ncbi:MAG: hypothetical protein KAQ64_04045 [Candidatus Pacebacteria bacterium]|nr:hypothetical protein [Candidatus Paceibacterota bacterium]